MKKLIILSIYTFGFCWDLSGQTNPEVKNIALFLQPNVEVLDFAGPLEVFQIAGFNTYTVSLSKEPMKAMDVLTVVPDYDLKSCPQPDVLAFFGGGDTRRLSKDSTLMNWITKTLHQTPIQFSVCTGAYFLGEAGYLDNLYTTTYHLMIDDLQSRFPKSKVRSKVRFVDNGAVITTAGISAGIDGALHLVAKIKGNLHAKQVAKAMEYDKWVPNEGMIIDHPFVQHVLSKDLDSAQEYLLTEPMYKGELLNLSEKLMQQKRWMEAEKCIQMAMSKGRPDAKDYELLGQAYKAQGKFAPPSEQAYFEIIRTEGVEKATQILMDVKSKYKDWMIADPMQFLHLSYLEYYRKGKIDDAIQIMKLELQHYPEYVYGHYWMGRYYEDKGVKNLALKHYLKALDLDATFVEAKEKVEELANLGSQN